MQCCIWTGGGSIAFMSVMITADCNCSPLKRRTQGNKQTAVPYDICLKVPTNCMILAVADENHLPERIVEILFVWSKSAVLQCERLDDSLATKIYLTSFSDSVRNLTTLSTYHPVKMELEMTYYHSDLAPFQRKLRIALTMTRTTFFSFFFFLLLFKSIFITQ